MKIPCTDCKEKPNCKIKTPTECLKLFNTMRKNYNRSLEAKQQKKGGSKQ